MSRRQLPILPILGMLAIAAGCYALYKNTYIDEVEYEVEQSVEALRNRLLAASFLLESEGFEYEIKDNRRVFAELDKSDGVLWLTDTNELEDQREAAKIIAWVESGGILLTSPSGPGGLEDSSISGWMLEELGIEQIDEDDEQNAVDKKTRKQWEIVTLPDKSLENPKMKLFSDYEPYFQVIQQEPENSRTLLDTPYLIHRSVGEGYVAVYADEALFDSNRLDVADQGYLLLWLTQPATSKTVSIVFRPASTPGLFTVLWNKFPLAILLSALALICFLRWAASRLGPVEQELPPIKNNIMAHLEARGEYWYRHKYTNKILGDVQAAAQENMLANSGKLKAGAELDNNDRSALIKQACEQLQCSPQYAERILFSKARTDSNILSVSQALQRLNHRKPYKPK